MKAIVIPVDEFRTSVRCCHYFRALDLVYPVNEVLSCNHRYEKNDLKFVSISILV